MQLNRIPSPTEAEYLDRMEAEYAKIGQSDDASRTDFPAIPRKTIVATFHSGEIRIESGADGAWILFDCACTDALPYCRAQCCALQGTIVFEDEPGIKHLQIHWDSEENIGILKRDSDGHCTHLCRQTRTCTVYECRPKTCRDFHCTRGANMRGFKLKNSVDRHSNS